MAATKVSMGEYLYRRLISLGIEHVFGVPGDFNCRPPHDLPSILTYHT